MSNSAHSINLLHTTDKSKVDSFIEWALTIGRFLVILTETIALITFISRFSLDRQLVNLHDEIKRDQQYIQAFSSSEVEFRKTQDRLAAVKKLDNTTIDIHEVTKDILGMVKNSATINLLSITPDGVHIDCTVTSITAVTGVVNAIKGYSKIGGVSVDKIENKSSTGVIALTISASFKSATK